MKTTESKVAQGAREARRDSLPRLLDITIRAVLNDAIDATYAKAEEEARVLAKQLSSRREMEQAFLQANGDKETNRRQTLAEFGQFIDDVTRRYEALQKGPDESTIKQAKAVARRTIADAVERTMGDNHNPTMINSDLRPVDKWRGAMS